MAEFFRGYEVERKYPYLVRLVNQTAYDSLEEFIDGENFGYVDMGKLAAELLMFFNDDAHLEQFIDTLEPLVMEFLGEVV